MRKPLAILLVAAALIVPTAALAGPGWGRHGGPRHGWSGHHYGGHFRHHHYHHAWPRFYLGYGAPYWWCPPLYGAYGYGWSRPLVVHERVIEREAPVYIERDPMPAAERTSSDRSWYFCRSENAYYPEVERCPEAWIPVPPRSE